MHVLGMLEWAYGVPTKENGLITDRCHADEKPTATTPTAEIIGMQSNLKHKRVNKTDEVMRGLPTEQTNKSLQTVMKTIDDTSDI